MFWRIKQWMRATTSALAAVALCVAVASSNSATAQNYPGQPAGDYIPELNEGKLERWSDSRMPLKIFVVSGARVNGYQPIYEQFVYDALRAWSAAMRGQISFTQANSADLADMTIEWIDYLPKGTNEVGGITKIFPGPDGPLRAEIKLCTFPERQSQQNKLLAVMRSCALHEIGHALGITGHSSNPGDIMSGVIHVTNTSDFRNVALSPRDASTLYRIYNDPVIAARRSQANAATQAKRDIAKLGNEGNQHYSAGDYIRARQCYEQAFAIDRNHAGVRQNLALTYYQLGKAKFEENDYKAARQLLNSAIEIDQAHYLNGAAERLLQQMQGVQN